jgi:hypothetical protein
MNQDVFEEKKKIIRILLTPLHIINASNCNKINEF